MIPSTGNAIVPAGHGTGIVYNTVIVNADHVNRINKSANLSDIKLAGEIKIKMSYCHIRYI